MAGDTGTGLQEQVFVHSDTEAADFEIAFAATITTIALAFPSSGESIARYVRTIAVLLLVITLLRRMAVMDDYSDAGRVLKATSTGIEAITILTFTYILSGLVEYAPEQLAIVAIALIPIILIVAQELLFKNLCIYYAAFAYDIYNRDNILKDTAGTIAEQCLFLSRADIPDHLEELEYFKTYREHVGEGPFQPTFSRFIIAIGIGFYGLLFYFLSLIFSDVLLTAILLFYIVYIRLIVQFWYSAYGLPSHSELQSSTFERFLYLVTYVIVVYSVFQF